MTYTVFHPGGRDVVEAVSPLEALKSVGITPDESEIRTLPNSVVLVEFDFVPFATVFPGVIPG